MMTHEPCHGRVAREEQQHDRRVASLDLERARAAFVAFCQSASSGFSPIFPAGSLLASPGQSGRPRILWSPGLSW